MITKTFTITATPDTMLRFERFMAFFHFNGGHSGLFGMYFDGDGHERFKCDPPPDRNRDHWLVNSGQELETAEEECYKSYALDRTKHHYVAKDGVLTKVSPDGKEEIRKVLDPPEEEKEPTAAELKAMGLSNCKQCDELAWDGYICHACGAKEI